MLWTNSTLTRETLKHPSGKPIRGFSFFPLFLLSYILLGSILSVAEGSPVYLEMTDRRILQDDTIVTYISPVVERLSVDTFSSTPDLDFRVSFSVNETESSVVQMQPRSEGRYNLTVRFETEKAWNYTVGVFTNRPSFYSEYADIQITERGPFVRFFTRAVEGSSGNSTLVFVLDSQGRDPGPAPLNLPTGLFTLPESASLVVFIAVTAILGYANAFVMTDSYLKSRNEVFSWKRWALIVLLLAVSLWIIYQVYLSAAI